MATFDLPIRLGSYDLIHQIGEGGLASVFLAVRGNESFAIKCLKPDRTEDPRCVSQFAREAQIVAGLNHPNIPRVVDRGKAGGIHFVVFDLVPGVTLDDYVSDWTASKKGIPIKNILAIVRESVKVLSYLHQTTVYEHSRSTLFHGDFAPDNILFSSDGRLNLIDFGSAAQASEFAPADAHFGKLNYLPAEVLDGGALTAQTDIYGLGVIIYWLLFGKRPYEAKTQFDLADLVRKGVLPKLSAAELVATEVEEKALRIFLNQALHPDPKFRFATVSELERVFSTIHFSKERLTEEESRPFLNPRTLERIRWLEEDWKKRVGEQIRSGKVQRILPIDSLLAQSDRRQSARVVVDSGTVTAEIVHAKARERISLPVHELSAGGMLIQWKGLSAGVGDDFTISLRLKGHPKGLICAGSLLYIVTLQGTAYAGFQFSGMHSDDARALSDFVEARAKGAAPLDSKRQPRTLDLCFPDLAALKAEFEKNIQYGGVSVELPNSLPTESAIAIRVDVPGMVRRIVLTGKVVFCQEIAAMGRFSIGIQLDATPEEIRATFSDVK